MNADNDQKVPVLPYLSSSQLPWQEQDCCSSRSQLVLEVAKAEEQQTEPGCACVHNYIHESTPALEIQEPQATNCREVYVF